MTTVPLFPVPPEAPAPRWLPAVRDLLGTVPDQQVAMEAGAFIDAADVARIREGLGIPAYQPPAVP